MFDIYNMKNSKYLIYIIISLVLLLFLFNIVYYNDQEGLTNCTILSQQKPVIRETQEEFERKSINRLNSLQQQLDEVIYPLKFSKQNAKDLETIGPMQQSISDSQSGDVTSDTKLTGL